jgi:outer membrane immunogenic protein
MMGTAALLLVSTAHADGMPGSLKDAPVILPVCNWGGGYIGVDTGIGVTRTRWRFPEDEPDLIGNNRLGYFNTQRGDSFTTNDRGWVRSLHGGYNFPTNSRVIAGVELSYTGGDLEKRETSRFDPNDSFTTRINHIVELKGRIGYSWNCFMGYTKFGYARGRVETSAEGLTQGRLPIVGVGATEWHQGFTIGGGVEYMLTRNIVIGFEYDWVNLNRSTESTPVLFTTNGVRGSTLTRDIDPDAHLFVARLSYKFNQ